MFKTYDRIREISTSTGTGNFTLSAYADNYLRFSDVYAANTRFPYTIVATDSYESGIGYLNGSDELVRETVLSSTNFTFGDPVTYTSVTFGSGQKDVFCASPSKLSFTANAVPTDDYDADQFLVYGLNAAEDGWEWQLKYINAADSLPDDGSFPDDRVIFVNGTTFAVNDNLQFDPDTSTLTINGSLKANTKLFSIKHPIKPGKILNHGSLEGPELGIYFRETFDIKRKTVINIPDYFVALTNNKFDVFLNAQDGTRLSWNIVDNQIVIKRKIWNIFSKTKASILVIGSRVDEKFSLEE